MDLRALEADYVPPNQGCAVPMIPNKPEGCPSLNNKFYEPYVYRTGEMAKSSDIFIPCCKPTQCDATDMECRADLDSSWTARVIRFADAAQVISTTLVTVFTGVRNFTDTQKNNLDKFYRLHKDQHEEATLKMKELMDIGAVLQNDLQRCVKVMITVTDEGPAPLIKAAITPRGRPFDVMRAEAVGSGCASLERLLSIARREFYPRYIELANRLKANANQNRYGQGNRKEADTYVYKIWETLRVGMERLSNRARTLNISTISFYMLTAVPFLYTSVLTVGSVVPAVLLAQDKLAMLSRCMKLFCHFTQIPGVFIGTGIVLTNKLMVYVKQKKNQTKLEDNVAKGAMTFFTLMEKLISHNTVVATGVAAMGMTKAAGTKMVQQTGALLAQSVQAVADLGDNATIGLMAQTIQGIIMFIMTIMSSTIWKAVGMTCKAATKITGATVEGTAALASGAGTFLGGMGHLTSQLYSAAGRTLGFGLGTVGNAADMLGTKVQDLMDVFSADKEILQTLSQQGDQVETTLETLNQSLMTILGVTTEGVRDNIVDVLNTSFTPEKVKGVETLFRDFFQTHTVELKILFTVWAVAYGTWSWFQPVNDDELEKGISAILKESNADDDWRLRDPTNYVEKYNRIIPRPPANFVYQQCLREDPERSEECLARVREWTGLRVEEDEKPPAYRGSARRCSRRRGSARRARRRSRK